MPSMRVTAENSFDPARAQRRWTVGLFSALALCCLGACRTACDEPRQTGAVPRTSDGRDGLRVPLPKGWLAVPRGGTLEVGPPGRSLLSLEVFSELLPSPEAIQRAVVAGGGEVTQVDREVGLVVVRYAVADSKSELGEAPAAFVAVRSLDGASLGCALGAPATAEEAALALSTCRAVSWSR